MINKTKIYKIYGLIIKTSIILLAFWYIYRRLFIKDNLDDTLISFVDQFSQPFFIKIFYIVFSLMIINWSIETFKWKFLIGKIENVQFVKAFIAVVSGVTVSIFTPNRIGEFAGRVFILEKADRWEGILITMLGSMSQLLITIIAGSISFIFFANEYLPVFSLNNEYYFYVLVIIIVVIIIVLIMFFYNISFLTSIINKLPGKLKKISHYGNIFSYYNKTELTIALLLSLIRYLVFVTQFYFLLNLFGSEIPYKQAFLMISMIYLVMAAIPTIALTEMGIRGSVSLSFIGMYFSHHPGNCNDIGILTASSVLWLINLAFPAILGAVFVFRLKFFRKN